MDREEFLKDLKTYGLKNNIPNISLENAQFLREILKKKQVKNILEIGSANGYSTIHFASELEKWWGHITSIEFSQRAYEHALENFKRAGVEETISLYLWDARDIVPQKDEQYDFVFIDGLKKRSRVFLELVWDKVETNGIIIIDDVIKFKSKMPDLYEYVKDKNIHYEIIPIDGDDGIMKIIKTP